LQCPSRPSPPTSSVLLAPRLISKVKTLLVFFRLPFRLFLRLAEPRRCHLQSPRQATGRGGGGGGGVLLRRKEHTNTQALPPQQDIRPPRNRSRLQIQCTWRTYGIWDMGRMHIFDIRRSSALHTHRRRGPEGRGASLAPPRSRSPLPGRRPAGRHQQGQGQWPVAAGGWLDTTRDQVPGSKAREKGGVASTQFIST
jgi:hypothetical protein